MIVLTAMFWSKSPFGTQVAPPSVDFQIPPPTPAAHIVVGLPRSITNERVRPPTLPGPRCCQVPPAALVSELVVPPEVGSPVPVEVDSSAVEWIGIHCTASIA